MSLGFRGGMTPNSMMYQDPKADVSPAENLGDVFYRLYISSFRI